MKEAERAIPSHLLCPRTVPQFRIARGHRPRLQLERDAVVHEEKAIVVAIVAVVADAVADIQKAAVREREGHSRRKVSKEVLAAEPIHDDAHVGMQGLLIACQDSGFRANPRVFA